VIDNCGQAKFTLKPWRMAHRWTEDRLLKFVGQIYEAAADPNKLSSLSTVVQNAMDVGSALLFVSNHQTGELIQLLGTSPNFDVKARADYRAHYHNTNPWYHAAKNKKGAFIRHGGELIGYDEFEKTEFRADWCKRVGIYHFLGGTAPIREGVAVALGLHRPKGSVAFDEDEKRAFSILLEHIVRACQLADKIGTLAGRELLTYEVLSKLNVGFVLVDRECRAIHVNALAENLLRASRWLTYSQGRVRPIHPVSRASFEKLVADAASASAGRLGSGGVISLDDPIEAPLAFSIMPFKSEVLGLGAEQTAVAILFSDPDQKPVATPEGIAKNLGLTTAESRLVARLVQGESLVEAARSIGISPNTAKTQLQSVFIKTDTSKQSEIVSRVVANPVVRLRLK
jgi:DNA-binding CsgD family transcriptional regulator